MLKMSWALGTKIQDQAGHHTCVGLVSHFEAKLFCEAEQFERQMFVRLHRFDPSDALSRIKKNESSRRFCHRSAESIVLSVHGQNQAYQILAVNSFNSTRKRMSTVARAPDGRVWLWVKGADNETWMKGSVGDK